MSDFLKRLRFRSGKARRAVSARALLVAMSLAGLLLPSPALAECSGVSCNNVRISQFYIQTSGSLYIQPEGSLAALSCTPASGVYLTLEVPPPSDSKFGQFQAIYSLLLTRFEQGKPVQLRIAGGSNGCTILYVTAVAN